MVTKSTRSMREAFKILLETTIAAYLIAISHLENK